MFFLPWLAQLAIGLLINIVAYLIQPRPKGPKPPEAKDMDSATAEAGRPIPIIFGEITITGVNCMWAGQKQTHTYKVSA